jgi:hypothetical protein
VLAFSMKTFSRRGELADHAALSPGLPGPGLRGGQCAHAGEDRAHRACIDDIQDELFLKHDLNLFNFVIRLNQALRAEGRSWGRWPSRISPW